MDKLSPTQLEELDENPSLIQAQLSNVIDELKNCAEGIDRVKIQAWDDCMRKTEETMTKLYTTTQEAEDQLAAVMFLVSENSKQKKAAQNAMMYQRFRAQRRLVYGGFDKNIAKRIALDLQEASSKDGKIFQDISYDIEEHLFDCKVIMLWSKKANKVEEMSKLYQKAIGAEIKGRMQALQTMMDENSDWGGAMTRCESILHSFEEMFIFKGTEGHWTDKGLHPWVVATKALHARFGAHAWPMPGYGCLLRAESSPVQHFVYLVPVDGVLSRGISLPDMMKFLDSPSGVEFATSSARILILMEGDLLWIPFGWIVLLVTRSPPKEEKEDGSSAPKEDPSIGMFSVLTVYTASMAKSLSPSVWSAIQQFNEEQLSRTGHKHGWSARAALAAAFTAEVAA